MVRQQHSTRYQEYTPVAWSVETACEPVLQQGERAAPESASYPQLPCLPTAPHAAKLTFENFENSVLHAITLSPLAAEDSNRMSPFKAAGSVAH